MAVSDSDQSKLLQASGGPVLHVPAPISSSFCLPHASQFKVVELMGCCGGGAFEVVDFSGSTLCRFSQSSFWSSKQVLHDDYGREIATLNQKRFSSHLRWNVYGGTKSQEQEDLLFTMAKPKVFQSKISFNIWLAGKEEPDFNFSVNNWENHFKISHRGVLVAEADYNMKLFKPNELTVTANAGVDRAFIASLLVMQLILARKRRSKSSGGVGGGNNCV